MTAVDGPDPPDAIAPDGSAIYFRIADAQHASLVEVSLPPEKTSRPVRHRTVEEIWHFLSGSGEVWLRSPDGATSSIQRVAEGSSLSIPVGWDFQFRSLGPGELRFLCFTSPPWPGPNEAVLIEEGGLGPPSV